MTDRQELNNSERWRLMLGVNRQPLTNILPVAILLLLFNVAAFESASIASRAFGIAFLLIVPGTVLMSLTPIRPKEISVRLSLSVGTSMLLLMLLGLIYSMLLPHIGIARPLSRSTVVIGIDIVSSVGLAVQIRHRDPLTYLAGDQPPSWSAMAITAMLALLPLGAIVGAERLNNGDSGAIALAVLVAIGVILCGSIIFVRRMPRWSVALVLYAASAAALLMTSMRSTYPFGYDIQTEYHYFTQTLHGGIWHLPHSGNAYAAMLSITVLPSVISLATHATGIYLFKLVYPLIFSLFPVMVYATSARWFPRRAALIGAVVLLVQGYYAADMTGLARQEVALVYFALLIVVAFDETIAQRPRQVAAVIAGVGMAISHYSTAYFASTILIFGFLVQLLFRRSRWWRSRGHVLLALPVVVGIVGVVALWNVVITRSAQNVVTLASSIQTNGFQFLSGGTGSLVTRFLNADTTPSISATQVTPNAVPYYRTHSAYLHPYPTAISKLFPLKSVTIPVPHANAPALFGNLASNLTAVLNELLLLLIGIGIIVFLWRLRKSGGRARVELGFIALGTVILLAILRLSGTVSGLYNAPRGQVQGAPLLSVGLACVFTWMFTGRSIKRITLIALTTLCLGLLFFVDSGMSGLVLGGGAADTLVNYGDSYETNYFTRADIASASWVAEHDAKGQVVYADDYGALQLYQVGKLNVLSTIIPSEIEPGALVYADTTNIVDKTAFANFANYYAVYQFPLAFLNQVKDVVFSTGTTEVFR